MWPIISYPEVSIDSLNEKYDYIVVGGGTAGCVLANRLSADPSKTVLLLERGPRADSWASRVPLFSSDVASDGSPTLKRTSEKQDEIGRPLLLFSGGALGGTSRVNQAIYTRGLPAEYDRWAAAGRKGLSWEELRPYFLKSECALSGAVEGIHSTEGEWKNRTLGGYHFDSFSEAVSAAEVLGLPHIDDINSPIHPPFGCGQLHFTIDEKGHRNSAYDAFLPDSLANARKANLHICTNVLVEKIDVQRLENGSCAARGVTLLANAEKNMERRKHVEAHREIVLSVGLFGSPQILMLRLYGVLRNCSGIGPSEHLKEHGIPVVKDLHAVGLNLQDHFGVSVGFFVPMRDSLLSLQTQPWRFFMELLRYLIWGTGLLLGPVLQLAIFMHTGLLDSTGQPTKAEKEFKEQVPGIEIMPLAYGSIDVEMPRSRGLFSFLNVLLHPRSKGTVRLSSSDPREPLIVDPQFLSNPADIVPLRASVKLSLRLCDQMRKHGYMMDDWLVPESESDEDLDRFIRTHNRTTYHYSSTCRMAPEDDAEGGGVVDDELRVYGVRGLRVADTSILLWILGTHLQAPAVMIGEKCADMILRPS
ncbi:GMC oxidoreductase [Laetiporus sulphureus 93-53]|uniref:GMC oxidoreductase n=1 Tax=Laetiporus sulphureus 93-53 TaxID=1314785 RepID=A0A165F2J0_9APHY|nr:GMC oxidoreductase [Laetiporus sulphureus 93-53]KZT08238.1 GMC oxidoreductase [Laetiporus sulphureus 93-53]